jgi:hypothetical protein
VVQAKEDTVSRLALIIVALAVGVVLAVGAVFATTGLLTATPPPVNHASSNYGG